MFNFNKRARTLLWGVRASTCEIRRWIYTKKGRDRKRKRGAGERRADCQSKRLINGKSRAELTREKEQKQGFELWGGFGETIAKLLYL